MARIAPLAGGTGNSSADLQSLIDFVGYRPNALFTMAKRPGLLEAVLGMVRVTIRGEGISIPEAFRFLLAAQASRAAGCRYSAAHAAHAAAHAGMDAGKIAALADCETSASFTPAERAALRLAAVGGGMPVRDAAEAFSECRVHYSEDQILEIVGIVSLFGWFNRWNSLMQSDLEDEPGAFAARIGWLDPVAFTRQDRR